MAKAIEKRPQSYPPDCICTSIKLTVMVGSSVVRRVAIWALAIVGTHMYKLSNVCTSACFNPIGSCGQGGFSGGCGCGISRQGGCSAGFGQEEAFSEIGDGTSTINGKNCGQHPPSNLGVLDANPLGVAWTEL